MNKINLIIFGVAALALNSGCDKELMFNRNHHVTGQGTVKTIYIATKDFSKIKLENVANVYVTTGVSRSVEFTAYENILEYMEANVTGDELVLSFRNNVEITTDKEIRIDITMPEVEKVTLNGVGNFNLGGPVQEQLNIKLNGVGNVKAFELPVYKSDIDINGSGNVEIQVKESLSIDINGIGNVYYQGSPELSYNINGLGDVIKD